MWSVSSMWTIFGIFVMLILNVMGMGMIYIGNNYQWSHLIWCNIACGIGILILIGLTIRDQLRLRKGE